MADVVRALVICCHCWRCCTAGVAMWLQIGYNAEKRNATSANLTKQLTDEGAGDHGRGPKTNYLCDF